MLRSELPAPSPPAPAWLPPRARRRVWLAGCAALPLALAFWTPGAAAQGAPAQLAPYLPKPSARSGIIPAAATAAPANTGYAPITISPAPAITPVQAAPLAVPSDFAPAPAPSAGGSASPLPTQASQLPTQANQLPTQANQLPTQAGQSTQAPLATAPASAAAPAAGAGPTSLADAVRILLEQAAYWRAQYQPDRAIDALNRALQLDPNNVEALVMLAQIQADAGNRPVAQAALARLRQVAPGDPRLANLDQLVRTGPVDADQLSQARNLAQSGRVPNAVDTYKRIFHSDTPPDRYAVEYYSTLAGTDNGWDTARTGMAHYVISNPSDMRGQLAYAQILSYRESTRPEAIQRLTQLTANPTVADQARQSLHQALNWLPNNASSIPLLQAYLAANPTDAEVQHKLDLARNPPRNSEDVVGQMRLDAFTELNRGHLADAEKTFAELIQRDPNDSDALGGLGVIRLRQGRNAEARQLLERAIAADPTSRPKWAQALAGTNAGVEFGQVRTLSDRGDYAGAEQLLLRLTNNKPDAGATLLLADIQSHENKLAEAEGSYRAVLNRSPNNPNALLGLASVLQKLGRNDEADEFYARAEKLGNQALIGQARATDLRNRAQEVPDPVAQAGLYRAAVAADPKNPWIRLDFARTLRKLGRAEEGRQVMAELIASSNPPPDALQAAMVYAQESNDAATVNALVARTPANRRTPEMRAIAARAQLQTRIDAAMITWRSNRNLARQRLLALAAGNDPDGSRGATIARAMLHAGDREGAREAIATAQAANHNGTAAARLAWSGALLDAGLIAEADAIASSIDPARLPADQARAGEQMRAGIAVRAADAYNQMGKQAEAYDQLAPILSADPTNPDANMALARIYAAANQPKQAQAITTELLRRDPANLDIRRAAVAAAISAHDWTNAQMLVREAIQLQPGDPRSWLISADLARARGNNSGALHDLQQARDLRRQQLGDTSSASFASGDKRQLASGRKGHVGNGAMTEVAATEAAKADPNIELVQARPASLPPDVTQDSSQQTVYNPFRRGGQQQDNSSLAIDTPAAEPVAAAPLAPPAEPAYQVQRYTPPAYQQPNYATTITPAPGYTAPGYATPTYPTAAYPAAGYAQPAYQPAPYAPPPAPVQPQYAEAAPEPAVSPLQAPPPYFNPFRRAVEQQAQNAEGPVSLPVIQRRPADAMTDQIESQIATLQDTVAPKVQAGVSLGERSGSAGLDSLTTLMMPVEATYAPFGYGELKLTVTPVMLSAGSVGTSPTALAGFGTLPLYALSPNTPPAGEQSATGVGFDVGYALGPLTVDAGSTPYGFRTVHPQGGVEFAPQIGSDLRLRVTGDYRPMTDSLLSYAGSVDPRTGLTFGGVMRARGHAQLEYTKDKLNLYAGGGGAMLSGTHVQNNTEFDAGMGGSYAVYQSDGDEVRVGLDLVYFGYLKNLDYFTLGNGGYYSPQSYFAALVPINYTSKSDDLTWGVGGSIGFQNYREQASRVFPIDWPLQAQLIGQGFGNAQIVSEHPAVSGSGPSGTLHGDVDYRVSTNLHVGGRASFQRTGDWNEAEGMVYARYMFANGI